jgi:molybdopterin-synthase adenylyltransferase
LPDIASILSSLEAAAVMREECGGTMRCVSHDAIEEAAGKSGMASREVSILALRNGLVPLRYVKNIGTLGMEGQARLLASRVLVVGGGGIGGAACELLARMGVGTVVVVDPDVFDETNLNRQDFCHTAVLGMPKVEVLRDALGAINPECDVVIRQIAATTENLPGLLAGADAAIDALDNIDDRLVLQDACSKADATMVHGAIAGTSLEVTAVFPGDPGIAAFAPVAEDGTKARGVEIETGNPAVTPVLCAAIQVSEAVKVLLGKDTPLRGRMLYMDTDDWSTEFIDL